MRQLFTSGSQSIEVSASASVLPTRLIYFRIDWFDLLWTLKSLLQHHSSKASILQHSAFFIVQLSQSYMTTGKTIALTRQTFVGKVMTPLVNMLSKLVIAFLPRSKHLLISMAAVTIHSDLGDQEDKVCLCDQIPNKGLNNWIHPSGVQSTDLMAMAFQKCSSSSPLWCGGGYWANPSGWTFLLWTFLLVGSC